MNEEFYDDAVALLETEEKEEGWTPERRLALAVLVEAYREYRRCLRRKSAAARRRVKKIEQWLAREDDWVFSFKNLCAYVNRSPRLIRRAFSRAKEDTRKRLIISSQFHVWKRGRQN